MWTLMLVIFVASGASTGGVGATTTFLDFPDEAKCRTAADAIAGADQMASIDQVSVPIFHRRRSTASLPNVSHADCTVAKTTRITSFAQFDLFR